MQILLYQANSPSKSKDDVFIELKSMATQLTDKYKNDGSRIAWVSIRLPQEMTNSMNINDSSAILSSTYANQEILSLVVIDLALRKIGLDSLVMLCSNGMTFKQDVLNRVRIYTIFANKLIKLQLLIFL